MYSDEGLIAEFDGSGSQTKSYGYAPNSTWTTNPLFMKQGGQYYFYHNDHLGTPQKLTSASGAISWSATYDAFGKATVAASATVTNNLRFAGQYYDSETGLHYNYHRYYDPRTGRYITTDPIGLEGGINLLSYVKNNPLIRIDPLGLTDCGKCSYCPNGKWDVDHGFSASAVILIGGTGTDITFTCLSNNKKCKGKLYCGIAGGLVDLGVGWVVDFESIGGGRTISGKCNKSDVQEHISSGWVLIAPLKLAGSAGVSGNTVNFGLGFSVGVGYAWCHAAYVSCDD
jgi:RHS repeat-associated protein